MRNVTAKFVDTDKHELTITAKLTLGEWREVNKLIKTSNVSYYAPLNELLDLISRVIVTADQTINCDK